MQRSQSLPASAPPLLTNTHPAPSSPAESHRREVLTGLLDNFEALDHDRDGVLRQSDLTAAAKPTRPAVLQRAAALALNSRDPVVVEQLRSGATRISLGQALAALALLLTVNQLLQQDRDRDSLRLQQEAQAARSKDQQLSDSIEGEQLQRRALDRQLEDQRARLQLSMQRAGFR